MTHRFIITGFFAATSLLTVVPAVAQSHPAGQKSPNDEIIHSTHCQPGDPLCSDLGPDKKVVQPTGQPTQAAPVQDTSNQSTFNASNWRSHVGSDASFRQNADQTAAQTSDTADGYQYTFGDDPLSGKNNGEDSITIKDHHFRKACELKDQYEKGGGKTITYCCFDSWMAALKKGDHSDADDMKDAYRGYLNCMDPCLTRRDLQFLSSCADWETQAKLINGEGNPDQVWDALEGQDLFSCKKEVVTQAIRENKINNRRMQPNGSCVPSYEVPDFSMRFLTLAAGMGDLSTCKGNCSNTGSAIGTVQAAGFFARRTDNIFMTSRVAADIDYVMQPPMHDTKATLVGYKFGGDLTSDFALYRTLLDKWYTCTPIVGGRVTLGAHGDGGMANTNVLDAAIQAGAGIVCSSGKSFAIAVIGNADLGRGTVFALYPGEAGPGMDENVRTDFSRVGQGGSGQLQILSQRIFGTVEAGGAVYSTALKESEKYLNIVLGAEPFKGAYVGPSFSVIQYDADVTQPGGADKHLTDTDWRPQIVFGIKF